MSRYLSRRLLHSLGTLLIISLGVFLIMNLAPGGPAVLMAQDLSEEDARQIRANLGLDRPVHVRYVKWMAAALWGDLGRSFSNAQPVAALIADRLPPTLLLGLCSLGLALVISVPVGVAAARRPGGPLDLLAGTISFFGVSLPAFWFGLMLIMFLSVQLGLLPSAGMYKVGAPFSLADRLQRLIMPAVVLALPTAAELTRYARSGMLEALRQDYMKTARAKGLSERVVLYRHALKNGLLTVVTVLGLSLPRLVGGAAITEHIFAWPGMGRLAVASALGRDYPVVMGVTIAVATMVILSNLLTDLAYPLVDPRVRVGRSRPA